MFLPAFARLLTLSPPAAGHENLRRTNIRSDTRIMSRGRATSTRSVLEDRVAFDAPAYAVIDLETTGLDEDARVISFAVVYLRADGSEIRRNTSLFNPGAPIPPEITALTGISDQEVADAPRFEELASRIRNGLRGPVVVSHNWHRFDGPMLKREFARAGLAFSPEQAICTVELAQTLMPDQPDHKLESLCEAIGEPLEGAHEAMADTLGVVSLLNHWLTEGLDPRAVEIDRDGYYRQRSIGDDRPASDGQKRRIFALARENGITDAEGRVDKPALWKLIEQTVPGANIDSLTRETVQQVFDAIQAAPQAA